MQTIRLLGVAGITQPGGEWQRTISRDRIALLATLALSPTRSVQRDRIQSLLWPDCDPEEARARLRQTLYRSRIALGDHALYASGDALRLDPDHVGCDVWEFEAAVARNDWERAVESYGGPLLDGWTKRAGADLRRFITRERLRLADLYGLALDSLHVPEGTVIGRLLDRPLRHPMFQNTRGYSASDERPIAVRFPSISSSLQ